MAATLVNHGAAWVYSLGAKSLGVNYTENLPRSVIAMARYERGVVDVRQSALAQVWEINGRYVVAVPVEINCDWMPLSEVYVVTDENCMQGGIPVKD
ncbi:MAG: hypothetical protein D6706_15070 [Chloroflexi bacterium]|nr:MAG: hypothetical protein D6706_15070 [Chloroflexota bacterium]